MSDMEIPFVFKFTAIYGFLVGLVLGHVSIVVFHVIRVMLDKTT